FAAAYRRGDGSCRQTAGDAGARLRRPVLGYIARRMNAPTTPADRDPAGRGRQAMLLSAIDGFRRVKVAVVGDFILDRFVRGVIERISPEAPVPVLHGRGESLALGGAGNVVANIVALGGTALPVAAVGDDPAGQTILAMLAGEGVDT